MKKFSGTTIRLLTMSRQSGMYCRNSVRLPVTANQVEAMHQPGLVVMAADETRHHVSGNQVEPDHGAHTWVQVADADARMAEEHRQGKQQPQCAHAQRARQASGTARSKPSARRC